MSHVNMKYLRTFLVMVEKKSSAKTARCLNISQDSVRLQIGRLERVIGKRLLQRRVPPNPEEMGRTQLTEDGRAFLPKAIAAVQAHDQLFEDKSIGLDPRTQVSMLATGLLEKALTALRHDLSEEEADRIYRTLLGGGHSDGT